MSINRWADREVVVYMSISIYTMESYSDIKNNAIWSNMDPSRDHYTMGNKLDRERQMSYITYMWNLKPMIKINLFTKQKRLIDIENKFMVIKGEKVAGGG